MHTHIQLTECDSQNHFEASYYFITILQRSDGYREG